MSAVSLHGQLYERFSVPSPSFLGHEDIRESEMNGRARSMFSGRETHGDDTISITTIQQYTAPGDYTIASL